MTAPEDEEATEERTARAAVRPTPRDEEPTALASLEARELARQEGVTRAVPGLSESLAEAMRWAGTEPTRALRAPNRTPEPDEPTPSTGTRPGQRTRGAPHREPTAGTELPGTVARKPMEVVPEPSPHASVVVADVTRVGRPAGVGNADDAAESEADAEAKAASEPEVVRETGPTDEPARTVFRHYTRVQAAKSAEPGAAVPPAPPKSVLPPSSTPALPKRTLAMLAALVAVAAYVLFVMPRAKEVPDAGVDSAAPSPARGKTPGRAEAPAEDDPSTDADTEGDRAASRRQGPDSDASLEEGSGRVRTAADLLFDGHRARALEAYRRLAEAHPDLPVYQAVVRVLTQPSPGGCAGGWEPGGARCDE